jgi:hypothetical protein
MYYAHLVTILRAGTRLAKARPAEDHDVANDIRTSEGARRAARRAGTGSSESRDGFRIVPAPAPTRPVLLPGGRTVITPNGFPLYL